MAFSVSPLAKTPIGSEDKFFRSIGDNSLDEDVNLLENGSQLLVVDPSLFKPFGKRKEPELDTNTKVFVDSLFKGTSSKRRKEADIKVYEVFTNGITCEYYANGRKVANTTLLQPQYQVKYQYPFGDVINCGGYGIIYSSKDENGDKIALKVSLKEDDDQEFVRSCIVREAEILRRLKGCKYFVQIINSYDIAEQEEENYHVIAMEYLYQKSVEDEYLSRTYLDKSRNIERSKSLSAVSADMFAKQFLEALVMLSEKKIVHLDISPNNVSWNDEKRELKIFDFSVSRILDVEGGVIRKEDDEIRDVPFTQYRSIEKILGLDQGSKDDLWSFACLLFKLYTGEDLFYFSSDYKFPKDCCAVLKMAQRVIGRRIPYEWIMKGRFVSSYYIMEDGKLVTRVRTRIYNGIPYISIKDRMIAAAARKRELLSYSSELNRLIKIIESAINYKRPPAQNLLQLYQY